MKKLLLTTALVALVSPAFAAEKGPTVTLGGSLDTQFGYRQQKTDYRGDNLTPGATTLTGNQLSKGGIVNDTKINVKVDGQAHGFKYGGLVSLNADTSANKYGSTTVGYQTMVYGEAKFGRLEAGSYTGAVDSLSVSAANIAKATGGIKGDARYWVNPNIITTAATTTVPATTALVANTFFVTPSLVSNMDTGLSANATKVTYYTPKFSGVKFGVSYIPDTEQMGTIAALNARTKTVATGVNQFAFRDVFSGGVMFDHKMNDVTFKASLLGETGTAKDFGGATVSKRDHLRSWELGASVAFKGFSLAASYGDLGKSGNTKSKVTAGTATAWKSAKSHYWTVGAAYDYSHFGASVTYLESKRGQSVVATSTAANPKASFKNISFGIDYRVAPGFMPYAEVSAFKLDSKAAAGTKNTGNVFLAGTKLHF